MQSNQKYSLHEKKSWYSRGYLPHYFEENITQFVTIRLHDSLPQLLLSEITEVHNQKISRERILALEKLADAGYGQCYLKVPEVARTVERSLLFLSGLKYHLHTWVIMPSHIHLLFTPIKEYSVASIVHSLKSYTANKANRLLKRKGQFWLKDYYDRYIRNEDHFNKAVEYIENNPVKAGLCINPVDWQFGTAYRRAMRG